jgi:hypothetical protein
MPPTEEIQSSLEGALRLARLDPAGMSCFNVSIEGFWRSFFAALITAPGYVILVADAYNTTGIPADLGLVVFVETLAYIANWLAFPLAAAGLTRLLGVSGRYVPLIVATNWSTVIQVAFLVACLLLATFSPFDIRTPLLTTALIVVLVYQWFVIRTSLQAGSGIALGLVVVDLIVSRLINMVADTLTG